MATFIDNATENDQVLEMAKLVSKLRIKDKPEGDKAFLDECSKLNEGNQHHDLIHRLTDELPLLIREATDRDVEGFVFLTVSLAKKIEKVFQSKVISKIIQHITSNVEEKPLLRLRLLNSLYNSLRTSTERHEVFMELLKFAVASKNTDLLINQVKENDLELRITEWNLNASQRRELLKTMRNIVAVSKSASSYRWSAKYLSSFSAENLSSVSEQELDDVSKIVLEAIRLPNMFQLDQIWSLPIVKRLESSKGNLTFQLLKIFVGENLESYLSFTQQHADFVNSSGLNNEDNLRKIRLLSLVSLACENQEIPYSSISKSLQIQENDVENWVITAISEDLICAKMDQLKRVVVITRSLQRVFTKVQWKQIADTLGSWRGNVQLMLNTLQESKKLNPNQQHQAFTKALQQS